MLDFVSNMLIDLRSYLPRLRRFITRDIIADGVPAAEEERKELKGKCADAGVDFQVVVAHSSPGCGRGVNSSH